MEIRETEYHHLLRKVKELEQENEKLKINEEKYRLSRLGRFVIIQGMTTA